MISQTLTYPSLEQVTIRLWGSVKSYPSQFFLSELWLSLRSAGSVDGPQLIPVIDCQCSPILVISPHQSALFSIVYIFPSAVPTARISPYSQGAQEMQLTAVSHNTSLALIHYPYNCFQTQILLSYPQVAITFSYLGCAHATYQMGPSWPFQQEFTSIDYSVLESQFTLPIWMNPLLSTEAMYNP